MSPHTPRPQYAKNRPPEADAAILARIRSSEGRVDAMSAEDRLWRATAAVVNHGVGKRIAARAYRVNEGVLRRAVMEAGRHA